MDRLAAALQRMVQVHPRRILAGFAVAFVTAVVGASSVQLDSGVESLMLDGDPDRARSRELPRGTRRH